MWFTNAGCDPDCNNSIGRITSTGVVTNYTDSTIDGPNGITAGPDGALWFTNSWGNSIGRITTSGVVTNYTGSGIFHPIDITTGPDRALWFTEGFDSIGRITTAGVITNYSDSGISYPAGITTGSDGALWFTNSGNNSIGRITTAGVVSNYTDPTIDSPSGITTGSDGALWVTSTGNASVGRITNSGDAITSWNSATAIVGSSFSFTVTTTGVPVPSITKMGKLPKHLKLVDDHDGTATISGVPTHAGIDHLTILATFGKGKKKSIVKQAFTLTVDTA